MMSTKVKFNFTYFLFSLNPKHDYLINGVNKTPRNPYNMKQDPNLTLV